MANLSQLIKTKSAFDPIANDINIEKGKIWTYTPGTQQTEFFQGICWFTPRAEPGEEPPTGTVIIEAWGAAGSGAALRCCGFGTPGNPPAYSKRTFRADCDTVVTGLVGMSCGNADATNFRGCSCPTELCIENATDISDVCMCVMGGRGGQSYCNAGSASLLTCFSDEGFSVTETIDGCGYVCNHCAEVDWIAKAYGGDVNVDGGISRIGIFSCDSGEQCCMIAYPVTSNNMFSEEGVELTVQIGENFDTARGGAQHVMPYFLALGAATKSPTVGMSYSACYDAGGRWCSCYQATGCTPYLGAGVPGLGALPCSGICDHGMRGGHGAVRIRFIRDE